MVLVRQLFMLMFTVYGDVAVTVTANVDATDNGTVTITVNVAVIANAAVNSTV